MLLLIKIFFPSEKFQRDFLYICGVSLTQIYKLMKLKALSRNVLSMFFFIFICLINAQIKFSGNFSFPPTPFKADTLDKSQVNVYYDIEFVEDIKNLTKKKTAIGILQIGKDYSKFVDNNQIKIDSLDREFSKLDKVGAKEFNLLMANKTSWNLEILKNKETKNNIISDKAYSLYQYEETQPTIDWKIGNNTKEILGYQCREATAKYRGRNYVAYFTAELPFSDGPHQFVGLPGLILEIYDNKEHFHFKAVGIDKNPYHIYLREEEDKYKTTRKKFRLAQKSFHQNPEFHIKGEAYNADGSRIEIKSKEIPYNPIELE